MSDTATCKDSNTTNLAGFEQYVTKLKQSIKRNYDRSVNKDLSQQNWQGLFKRNVTAVLQQAYKDALVQLRTVSFVPDGEMADGISRISVQALKSFDALIDELMQYALQKHRTSCALSNFPDEHKPSQEYIAEVIQEAEQDWRDFVSQVNTLGLDLTS